LNNDIDYKKEPNLNHEQVIYRLVLLRVHLLIVNIQRCWNMDETIF